MSYSQSIHHCQYLHQISLRSYWNKKRNLRVMVFPHFQLICVLTTFCLSFIVKLVILPFLGPLFYLLSNRLEKLIHKFYLCFDLKVVFKRGFCIGDMFRFKDKLPLECRSGVIYYTKCKSVGRVRLIWAKPKTLLTSDFTGLMATLILGLRIVHSISKYPKQGTLSVGLFLKILRFLGAAHTIFGSATLLLK